MIQRTFGPEQRNGKWYFYAYIDGQQAEWGPYSSEEFAKGAKDAIERRLGEEAADEPEPLAESEGEAEAEGE